MKKLLIMFLALTLSLTLVSCKNEEPETEAGKDDEETVTITDELGNEYTYKKSMVADIEKAFSILDEYTWEELRLFDEKEKYLWGPEEDYFWVNLGDFAIQTVPVHAGVEVVNGDGTVMTYFVDPIREMVIIWDEELKDYDFIIHEK